MAKSKGITPTYNVADRKAAISGVVEYIESELRVLRDGLASLPDDQFSDMELTKLFGHLVWGFNHSLRSATDSIGLNPFAVSEAADAEQGASEAGPMEGAEGMPQELRDLLASLSASAEGEEGERRREREIA